MARLILCLCLGLLTAPALGKVVYLGYPSPNSGATTMGAQMAPAVFLAAQDVNADPTILPGVELKIRMYDHKCQAGLGIRGTVEVMQDTAHQPMVGLVDGGCSGVTIAIADVAEAFSLVSISGVAGAPILSDKTQFPYFFRTAISNVGLAPAAVKILERFKWTKFGAIAENIDRDTSTMVALLSLAATKGITPTTKQQMFPINGGDDPTPALKILKEANTKIFMCQVGPGMARKVFCAAYKLGMTNDDTQWVIPSWFGPKWWRVPSAAVDCTAEEMDEATRGYLGYEQKGQSLRSLLTPAKETPAAFTTRYVKAAKTFKHASSYPAGGIGIHQGGYMAYDAVWAWAYALHDVTVTRQAFYQLSFEDLAKDGTGGQDALKDALYRTNFQGVSGQVTFDPKTADREGLSISIENNQNGTDVEVMVLNPDNTLYVTPGVDVVWRSSTPDGKGGYVKTGMLHKPDDGSQRVIQVQLSMLDDTDNGFGLVKPWGRTMNGKSLAQYSMPGVRLGIIPSLLTTMMNVGHHPFKTSYGFTLNTTIPAVDRTHKRKYAPDAIAPIAGKWSAADRKVPDGLPGCRCIGQDDIDTSLVQYRNATGLYPAHGHLYPRDYGSGCKKHDATLLPTCNPSATGERPSWCDEPWCWVDGRSCPLPSPPSANDYFPEARGLGGGPIFFSYETCGAVSSAESIATKTMFDQPDRVSWEYGDGLLGAVDICEELLQMGPDTLADGLRAAVVPLEPSVTKGYHPCWNEAMHQELVYTPKIGIMIAKKPPLPDVLSAAVISLVQPAVLKAMSFFIVFAFITGTLIWYFERYGGPGGRGGMFEDVAEYAGNDPGDPRSDPVPAPYTSSMELAMYWAMTTGTSTGYGDRTPSSRGGRVVACTWMILGIVIFALLAGSLTNEIITLTTDQQVYSLADARGTTKAGIIGQSYYGAKHQLLTKSPITNMVPVTRAEGVEALINGTIDALFGAYPTLIELVSQAHEDKEKKEASAKAANEPEPHIPNVYMTGDDGMADTAHFSYYIVFRESQFVKHAEDFTTKLHEAATAVRREWTISSEFINLPSNMRGSAVDTHDHDATSVPVELEQIFLPLALCLVLFTYLTPIVLEQLGHVGDPEAETVKERRENNKAAWSSMAQNAWSKADDVEDKLRDAQAAEGGVELTKLPQQDTAVVVHDGDDSKEAELMI